MGHVALGVVFVAIDSLVIYCSYLTFIHDFVKLTS